VPSVQGTLGAGSWWPVACSEGRNDAGWGEAGVIDMVSFLDAEKPAGMAGFFFFTL
jgi:hypothetical protein